MGAKLLNFNVIKVINVDFFAKKGINALSFAGK